MPVGNPAESNLSPLNERVSRTYESTLNQKDAPQTLNLGTSFCYLVKKGACLFVPRCYENAQYFQGFGAGCGAVLGAIAGGVAVVSGVWTAVPTMATGAVLYYGALGAAGGAAVGAGTGYGTGVVAGNCCTKAPDDVEAQRLIKK
ncbi:hypothetical protein D5018_07925 [Parashewanella curva]|uniref:Uncharacterized protein n=1 Tax=Parashewanella curva TaxID=2338552 RepID=A0A3L8PY52_9GAMM|nr:hypothetical protein [Parashewanella curva]RLV60185.1 hypothetical protein D5018_07925 [Parashewanella curva]